MYKKYGITFMNGGVFVRKKYILGILGIFFLVGCNSFNKIVGRWYYDDKINMFLKEDKTCVLVDHGVDTGKLCTWDYIDGQIHIQMESNVIKAIYNTKEDRIEIGTRYFYKNLDIAKSINKTSETEQGNSIKEAVSIDEAIFKSIENELPTKNVVKSRYSINGKIVNYYITVSDDILVDDAKKLGDIVVNSFDEEILNYYSIEVFIMKNDTSLTDFPIAGIKNPNSNSLLWTKDRTS